MVIFSIISVYILYIARWFIGSNVTEECLWKRPIIPSDFFVEMFVEMTQVNTIFQFLIIICRMLCYKRGISAVNCALFTRKWIKQCITCKIEVRFQVRSWSSRWKKQGCFAHYLKAYFSWVIRGLGRYEKPITKTQALI